MRGDLSSTAVLDVCRALAADGATGSLAIEGPQGQARILTQLGRVSWARSPASRARLGDRLVHAALLTQEQLDRALAEQAESSERVRLGAHLVRQGLVSSDAIRVFVQEQILDAIFEVQRWEEGTYEFVSSAPLAERLPVDLLVDEVAIELARRQREWVELEHVIPHLDVQPAIVGGSSTATVALEPDEFVVLANIDGQRSVRELADHLGYGAFEAARIVYGLTLLGVVEVADEAAADRGADALPEPAHDHEQARSHEPPAGPRPPERAPTPAAPGGSHADVSEFLRELSQLAVDEPPDQDPGTAGAPDDRRQPDWASGSADEARDAKRRRGLFGRGR